MTTVTPKKLAQSNLDETAVEFYEVPAGKRAQVTEMWIANTSGTSSREVTLYAHGTSSENTLLHSLSVEEGVTYVIDGSKIVLEETEVLAAKQDNGTDVVVTAYGVEEDVS